MKWPIRAAQVAWLPTVVVLAVVLIAGARLISLSMQHHSASARQSAVAAAAGFAGRMEPLLQRVAALAEQTATQAASGSPTAPPAANIFLMTADDNVLRALPADKATASGVASEWRAAESSAPHAGPAMLGPLRLGSVWLLAARAPVPAVTDPAPLPGAAPPGTAATPPGTAATPSAGWSVAYADLEGLLIASHLAHLRDMGYDFELSQFEPRSGTARIFVSSSAAPLSDAIVAAIRTPLPAAVPGSTLRLAIRPRAGWYPGNLLVSEIALLAFLAWLFAFGTHDILHALQRSRAALSAARRRLHSTHQQLAAEMQQRVTLQETFDHARFHDAFTGLPNRRYFMDQVDRALRELRMKRRERLAVIIVDITRLKLINDTLGHTAGDELMVQAARRFERSTSAFAAVFARWGDDQVALLLLDLASNEAALEVAALLQQDLRAPIELRRHRLIVMATMGVTCTESGQRRAEELVREADIALSAAKRNGTDNVTVYAPSMAGQAAELVSLEADLHIAMEKRELRLLFQPIVDLRTYTMVGAEALLRWCHPVEGLLAPERFLAIAEEAGLMAPITRWIILRVVRIATQWRGRLPAPQKFFISVNIAATALRDTGLCDFVATLLRESRLPPSTLKFELTEASLISNVGAARETLDRLHNIGVQLMLDDFGTGYSSLSYLQLFPFDYVKIDRPFANWTGSDQANTGMMAAMVQMAESLNLTAIAEIVETEAAARALAEMGCDFGQGFYFSEPLDVEQALQKLRTQQPFQPAREDELESATVTVSPLQEDDSPTLLIPAVPGGFPPERER
ncbi:MAG TPA: bifunctional diguanylate cyclase/phosphodiesterase [Steroidobacteraceae bacterium]